MVATSHRGVAGGGGRTAGAHGPLAVGVSPLRPHGGPLTVEQLRTRTQPLTPHAGPITFTRLKWVSFTHSCVYTALLVCAFVIGQPEPVTDVLGWSHGLLWIGMSLACIYAARLRIVSLKLAVAVA